MEDCLHTSSDNLAKLVRWAHSHGTICALIPGLKHLLTEGAHGNLTALWGCSAGHAYHWPLTSTCKNSQKDRVRYSDSRSINSDNLMQGAASAIQSNPAERFLSNSAKVKGDSHQTRDSCDFSNCSEPSEVDDNTEEYSNNLFDIVCESSATDEEGDSEPNHTPSTTQRKRGTPGTGSEDSTDPSVKKIKQERAEDYYTVANPQLPGGPESTQSSSGVSQSPKPNSHTRPSSRSSLSHSGHHKAPSVDGDSLGVSSSPLGSSSPHAPSMAKPMRVPHHSSQCKQPLNLTPGPNQSMAALHHPGKTELIESLPNDDLTKSALPFGDMPGGINPELDLLAAQALSADPKGDATVPPALYEIERLKALLQAERSKSEMMGETISSLKQDKELLQQELTKKAELICDFLQDQLRPDKRRGHASSQMEAGTSHQLIATFPDEGTAFESPALFDSFEEVELHPLDRQRTIKITKRSREGENTRVRMKNVVGVIARYMAALQEFRRSVSMKVAFDRVGVDRNTISRTAAIAELSLAAPEVFHALPPWDEKEETLAHYAVRCRQAMDENIKAKIKAMKAKGDLLPIVKMDRGAEAFREQNEKTIRSTQTALRNFRDFLISKFPTETREIYCIPCQELDIYLASFFVDARQKDGSEYEPNSLANYQCGLERYLKEQHYGYSITRDKEFRRSQEALKQKQLELKFKGKGNKPHKSMKLTFADELILRKKGLLSRFNPEGLLNLVWLNNTKAFGHCTGFHGASLKWGDVRLFTTETGLEYLEWSCQDLNDIRGRRSGTECRIYATPHSPQSCPVQDYKEYAQRRPQAMLHDDAPFYLSIRPVVNLAALHWYNCQALGKNKLAKMVKTMCEKGNIPGRKTNFSVYQSCSSLSEAQSNQLVLICNNLSQQATETMSSRAGGTNFVITGSFDPSDSM
ncbi:uncharacterized protein kiaa1958 [Chanos chanos]|uniref:Uncharacterized protein kiaa1958 n=1 Tax=Chanos chanos TaxID=29144 RepID=A0A6J2UWQ0_CHACN|nr:uncharacterized protein KIAA1958 homolog [Chanos chanos]